MANRALYRRTFGGLICRAAVLAGLTGAVLAASVSSASAAGKAVNVGTPFASGPPAVAVDSAGDAVVVWANTKDLGGANNFVQYCVLPVGGTACTHSGNLIPADGAQYIDGTQVLVDGGTIVVLADVYGAQGGSARDYEPEQEWQSTDGGATFNIVNGGLSIASANLNADTGPLNAVIMPGTNVLGYGWETAAGPPTFNAFPLTSPPECSKAMPCPFATLEPNTNPDTLGNGGGQFAAQAGASPGVLGVFSTLFSNGPFACPSNTPDGLAFAYGAGNQGAGNDYNTSPGSPGSAWKGPATQGQCGVQRFAVAGGPSGFGVLEDDEAHSTTAYSRFNQATMTFGPKVTVSKQGELYAAITQDAAGGIYATYMNNGAGGPIALSYSPDGGTSWAGPAQLDAYNGEANVISSVNGAGQGWVAWINNGSVYAQPFTAADAAGPPIVSGSGSTSGTTITITVTCTAFPCTVTITITAPPKAAADLARTHKKGKPQPLVLAKGRFTIRKGGPQKVTLRLTGAGKGYFKTHHGTVRVNAKIGDTFKGVTKTVTRSIRITPTNPKHHKK